MQFTIVLFVAAVFGYLYSRFFKEKLMVSFKLTAILWLVANLLDIHSTWLIYRHVGPAMEANILIRALMESLGFMQAMIFKLILTVWIIYLSAKKAPYILLPCTIFIFLVSCYAYVLFFKWPY